MIKFGFRMHAVAILGISAMGFSQVNYWDVKDPSKTPKTLSAMGIYKTGTIALPKKELVANAYHFDVNSPLWSDGSHKSRWILLKMGKKVGFVKEGDYYTYPDSAMFIKEFSLDTTLDDPASAIRWETRILYNKKEVVDSTTNPITVRDHWYSYSYKWDRDQKDARLIDVNLGLEDTLRVYSKNHKTFRFKKWAFPSQNACQQCHQIFGSDVNGAFLQPRSVLGFFTAQLNRQHPDSTGKINQLEDFFKKKILTPAAGETKPTNWDDPSVPRWAPIGDANATLDLRARSYIAANCSGCHGERGSGASAQGQADLDYDFHTMKPKMVFAQRSIGFSVPPETQPEFYDKTDLLSNPWGLDSLQMWSALVIPGYPQKSVVRYRQVKRNDSLSKVELTGNAMPPADLFDWSSDGRQMPPLATFETNEPALKVLADWIIAMPRIVARNSPTPNRVRESKRGSLAKTIIFEARNLRLPMEMASNLNLKVSITNIQGKSLTLKRVGYGVYAIPAGISSGVYMIRAGNEKFTRYLF